MIGGTDRLPARIQRALYDARSSCLISPWTICHGWRRAPPSTRPESSNLSPASISRATILSSPRSSLSASVP